MHDYFQIAGTYDINSGTMMLYVNGEEGQSSSYADPQELETNHDVLIGGSDSMLYSGLMSCLIIYDRPLQAEEMQDMSVCPYG